MAIKLYYDINTHQSLGKITGDEVWTQGDDDSKTLELYFGEISGGTGLDYFVNGLTNVTIFLQSCRIDVTRPDETSATISASQVTSGTEGYYKITIDEWVTNQAGTILIDAERFTASAVTGYGRVTQTIAEGTPGVEGTYALSSELDAVELNIALEEAFEIKIPDEELLNFKTVSNIVEYIEAKK